MSAGGDVLATTEQSLAAEFYSAVQEWSSNTERSQQASDRRIGVSDIGHCSEYVRRILIEEEPSQEPDKLAAFLGTWIGAGVEQAILAKRPDAMIQSEVTVELDTDQGSFVITGHPDVVLPSDGILLDVKTAYTLTSITSYSVFEENLQKKFQRHLYGYGCFQAGMFGDLAIEEILVGNMWVDRSGQDHEFEVRLEPLSLDVIEEAKQWLSEVVYNYKAGTEAPREPHRTFCENWCLAGETEVVTRQGIKAISELAGDKHDLLTPAVHREGLTWHGRWSEVEVKSFGVQPLRKITLRRGRQSKIVHATGQHRWLLVGEGREAHTTDALVAGDTLRSIRRNNSGSVGLVPVGLMHGYVYGDGTRGTADCRVTIYDRSNKAEMMEWFAGHRVSRTVDLRDGGAGWEYKGLPSLWKEAPDLRESTGYLTSWLAGYVAADGHVTPNGQVTISSARRESIELVRSVCAIVGVGYGPIIAETRAIGHTKATTEHTLYRVTLSPGTLPDWFFVRSNQRERRVESKSPRDLQWKVVSVEQTDRVEEVYCAVVPVTEAFALSDGLLTHNCEFFGPCRGADTDVEGLIMDDELVMAIEVYKEGGKLASEGKKMQAQAKSVLLNVQGHTDKWVLRTVEVPPSDVPAHTRRGYSKLSITKKK